MSDLIRRMDAVQACQVGPSDEWSRDTKSGYSQAATDCAMNILRIPADTVQAQIDEARLRETLHDLITKQSEGEWDDKTINKDVEVFLTAILALIRKGDQP